MKVLVNVLSIRKPGARLSDFLWESRRSCFSRDLLFQPRSPIQTGV